MSDAKKWRDVTIYSQSNAKRVPATFEYSAGGVRLVVTRHIHSAPDVWTMFTSGGLSIERGALDSKDIEDAKREALDSVRGYIGRLAKAFNVAVSP